MDALRCGHMDPRMRRSRAGFDRVCTAAVDDHVDAQGRGHRRRAPEVRAAVYGPRAAVYGGN
eukprot:290897-Rhodomonas_salina.1